MVTWCQVLRWCSLQIWRTLIVHSQSKTLVWQEGGPMSVQWAKKTRWLLLGPICGWKETDNLCNRKASEMHMKILNCLLLLILILLQNIVLCYWAYLYFKGIWQPPLTTFTNVPLLNFLIFKANNWTITLWTSIYSMFYKEKKTDINLRSINQVRGKER